MLTTLYLLLALAAACAAYLACAHQRLWPASGARRAAARAAAWLCSALALAAAIATLGVWAGVFSALTAWMLGAVLLPYLDAWRRTRSGGQHVG